MTYSFKQVFVRLATKEQIVINVILDTMVMELHVLSVALTRLLQQVVLLQLQQIVSWFTLVDIVSFSILKISKLMSKKIKCYEKAIVVLVQLQQIVSWFTLVDIVSFSILKISKLMSKKMKCCKNAIVFKVLKLLILLNRCLWDWLQRNRL